MADGEERETPISPLSSTHSSGLHDEGETMRSKVLPHQNTWPWALPQPTVPHTGQRSPSPPQSGECLLQNKKNIQLQSATSSSPPPESPGGAWRTGSLLLRNTGSTGGSQRWCVFSLGECSRHPDLKCLHTPASAANYQKGWRERE